MTRPRRTRSATVSTLLTSLAALASLAALTAFVTLACTPATPSGTAAGASSTLVLLLAPPGAGAGRTDAATNVPGVDSSPAAAAALRAPALYGNRLLLWDSARPERPGRPLLADEPQAIALCDSSPDGTRLLITLRQTAADPWRVCELTLAGGPPRPLSPAGSNAVWAAYLPDQRLVFASDLAASPDPLDGQPALQLYTSGLDGSDLQRISFHPSSDGDPTVLPDGRVLFASWLPPGADRATGGLGLFTVRHDGTGLAAYADDHAAPGDRRRPRLLGGRLFYLTTTADGRTTLACLDRAQPLPGRRAPPPPPPGRWAGVDLDGSGALLLCGRPGADGDGGPRGLYRASNGALTALLTDPSWDVLDVLRPAPHPAPRGHVSSVDRQRTTGELLCLDARRADGLSAEDAASARRARSLRVLAALPSAAHSAPLATLDLASDGSAWLTVPADTPLRWQTLDDQGQLLLESRSWIWVRPGEQRACIGCHEDRQSAPSNHSPAALRGDPVDLAALAERGTH